MDISKYLIIPIVTVSSLQCGHKHTPSNNMGALKSTDTALILKTEEANPLKGKPITAKQLIIPGKSIGQTKVDESMETVFERFGRPDSSDAAMGSSRAVWYDNHNKAGYKTSIFARHNYNGNNEVFQHIRKILVTSPYFRTTEGIGCGSTLSQIRKYYTLKQGNSYKQNGKPIDVYNDVAKGISFEIDPAFDKCVAVLVHKPNDEGSANINMH
ncbi:MAG: hypothetical protein JWR05_1843 [Mucilaginibacter sp.]|nr:hypothetical protein [Mucilaginibacter sp.]